VISSDVEDRRNTRGRDVTEVRAGGGRGPSSPGAAVPRVPHPAAGRGAVACTPGGIARAVVEMALLWMVDAGVGRRRTWFRRASNARWRVGALNYGELVVWAQRVRGARRGMSAEVDTPAGSSADGAQRAGDTDIAGFRVTGRLASANRPYGTAVTRSRTADRGDDYRSYDRTTAARGPCRRRRRRAAGDGADRGTARRRTAAAACPAPAGSGLAYTSVLELRDESGSAITGRPARCSRPGPLTGAALYYAAADRGAGCCGRACWSRRSGRGGVDSDARARRFAAVVRPAVGVGDADGSTRRGGSPGVTRRKRRCGTRQASQAVIGPVETRWTTSSPTSVDPPRGSGPLARARRCVGRDGEWTGAGMR